MPRFVEHDAKEIVLGNVICSRFSFHVEQYCVEAFSENAVPVE